MGTNEKYINVKPRVKLIILQIKIFGWYAIKTKQIKIILFFPIQIIVDS